MARLVRCSGPLSRDRADRLAVRHVRHLSSSDRSVPAVLARTVFAVLSLQGTRDLNPQPSVLETDALPVELVPFAASRIDCSVRAGRPEHVGEPPKGESTGNTEAQSNRTARPRVPGSRTSARPAAANDGAMTATPAQPTRARREPPRLATHRRHRRVRHAQGRREGQGAQGRGPAGRSASAPASPTSRPRRTSSRPRSRPAATRANHRYTPAGGLPELKQAIAEKTRRDSGLRGRARPGPGHQRRQAGHLRGVRDDARPGRRGDRAGAVLDDLPRGHPARRRRAGRRSSPTRPRTTRSPSSSSRPRAPTAPRCCCSSPPPTRPARSTPRRDPGDRPLGRGARPVGAHRRDLRAPGLRRRRDRLDARARAPTSPTAASSSTGSRRPTR